MSNLENKTQQTPLFSECYIEICIFKKVKYQESTDFCLGWETRQGYLFFPLLLNVLLKDLAL